MRSFYFKFYNWTCHSGRAACLLRRNSIKISNQTTNLFVYWTASRRSWCPTSRTRRQCPYPSPRSRTASSGIEFEKRYYRKRRNIRLCLISFLIFLYLLLGGRLQNVLLLKCVFLHCYFLIMYHLIFRWILFTSW